MVKKLAFAMALLSCKCSGQAPVNRFKAAGTKAYDAIFRLELHMDGPESDWQARVRDVEALLDDAARKKVTATDKHAASVLAAWFQTIEDHRKYLLGEDRPTREFSQLLQETELNCSAEATLAFNPQDLSESGRERAHRHQCEEGLDAVGRALASGSATQ